MLFQLPGTLFSHLLFCWPIATHPSWDVSLTVWSGEASAGCGLALPGPLPHFLHLNQLCSPEPGTGKVSDRHGLISHSRGRLMELLCEVSPRARPCTRCSNPTYTHLPLALGSIRGQEGAIPPLPCSPTVSLSCPVVDSIPLSTHSSEVTH